jgi:hypothetical protein
MVGRLASRPLGWLAVPPVNSGPCQFLTGSTVHPQAQKLNLLMIKHHAEKICTFIINILK